MPASEFPQVLRGERVELRPAEVEDAERFGETTSGPDASQWWTGWDAQRFARDITEAQGPCSSGIYLAIVFEGEIVGVMDYDEETEPEYRYAMIDITIADEWQGRGLGTDALRTLARWLIEERGHHRLMIDPAVDNERAIHVYEKVGFRRVGVMRRYELLPDGSYRDGLLLDLLAEELR